jgi:hypothetical protein
MLHRTSGLPCPNHSGWHCGGNDKSVKDSIAECVVLWVSLIAFLASVVWMCGGFG